MSNNPYAHGLIAANPIIEDNNFLVKLIDSRQELDEVCELRFKIFSEEFHIKESEIKDNRLDYDAYDDHNAHLIIIDKKTKQIIATYRMQTYEMAKGGPGFCSADRFDFKDFPLEMQQQGLEVARACIHKSYRYSKVFFLLWKGLAAILYQNKLRYFFGCSFAADYNKPAEVKAIVEIINNMDVHHKDIKLKPLPEFRYECNNEIPTAKKISLPGLLNRYLRFKCQICSEPCIDVRFLVVEFLLLYDAHCVSDHYHRMFLGDKPRIF